MREYSELKIDLAQKHSHDIEGYVEGKTNFILNILSQYSFDNDSLNQIHSTNQKGKIPMISRFFFTFLIFLPSVYGQVDLSFEIDENYLIESINTLAGRSRGKFSEDVKKFQNEIFEKHKKEYKQLQKIPINKINPVTIKKKVAFHFFLNCIQKLRKGIRIKSY